jgi:hypothetical protein
LSTDFSEYACQKYGHEKRDLATWYPRHPFDLVICQSVLQYLDDSSATTALKNLARATHHLLYFEVPTSHDLKHTVDRRTTDLRLYSRTGTWYREGLQKSFIEAGAGIWIKKGAPTSLYELERATPAKKALKARP